MKEIERELILIRESIIRIENDIAYHIARTDAIEDRVMPVWKAYIGLKWGIGSFLVIGAIAGAVLKIMQVF